MKAKYENLEMVIHVAKKLGSLLEKVVFLGGSATGLLISDSAIPDVRMTQDVDVIVEAATWLEYNLLERKLNSIITATECKVIPIQRKAA